MKVVDELLKIMENSGEQNLSGQELASRLGVSRTAVWKAVKRLREQGYEIEALRNKGYRLTKSGDMLSAERIKELLPKEAGGKSGKVIVLKTVNSTNTYAKKMAADGAENGTVIISEEQTAGRGRRGHDFFSPPKTGLYMSVILHPDSFISDADMVTVCAGCAVCRAIEELTEERPQIKWVNDIFLDGKKICGILSEGVCDLESGNMNSVIVGIGVNITTDAFPEEIKNTAGSISHKVSRNRIAAEIVKNLFHCLNKTREENIKEYKDRSLVLGKEVYFSKDGASKQGKALDIDEKGRLIVLTDSGREVLNSGEISVRLN